VLAGHEHLVTSVAIDPAGRFIVSGSQDGTVRLWPTSDRPPVVLGAHEDEVLSVATSPDGELIVSGGSDAFVRLWRPGGSGGDETLIGPTDSVLEVAVSPDGTTVAAGCGDGGLYLWGHGLCKDPVRIDHNSYVATVAFSPDGRQ